jgi:hypothetical protein
VQVTARWSALVQTDAMCTLGHMQVPTHPNDFDGHDNLQATHGHDSIGAAEALNCVRPSCKTTKGESHMHSAAKEESYTPMCDIIVRVSNARGSCRVKPREILANQIPQATARENDNASEH